MFVKLLRWPIGIYDAKTIIMQSFIYWNGFGQLWFIPCLFMCELLFYVTSSVLNKQNIWIKYLILYIIGLIGILICYEKNNGIVTIFELPVALIALGIMYVGNDYANDRFKVLRPYRKILLILWVICYFYFISHDIFINMGSELFPYYPFCILEAIGAILLFITCMKILPNSRVITYWGEHTLILYLVHSVENNFIPWNIVKEEIRKYLDVSTLKIDIITFLIRLFLIFIVSYIILRLISKFGKCRLLLFNKHSFFREGKHEDQKNIKKEFLF